MFDYHMHSTVSFDGRSTPKEMARAARERGLREICFTDHIDHEPGKVPEGMVFDLGKYHACYDPLKMEGLKIRRGVEYGLTPDNRTMFAEDMARNDYDFVLGSVHFVDGLDVYLEPYWQGKDREQVYKDYLQMVYECVSVHDGFDVLGHLTYISKCRGNPSKELVCYEDHREIVDEILRLLANKGIGMEMNTSGVDRCGGFLPTKDFFCRFKELGGRIVTIGSDAHEDARVGQYAGEACEILKDVFGYVCTFEGRKPIFHKL